MDIFFFISKNSFNQVMLAHVFNYSTQEARAGGSLNLRPGWPTDQVPEQPGPHRETLSGQTTHKTNCLSH